MADREASPGEDVPGGKPGAHHRKHGVATCKFCGKFTAMRSHRRHFLEFFRTRLTGKVPFRCLACHKRFWMPVDSRDL